MKRFKFGDRVTNLSAGDANPTKHGIFVRSFVRQGRLNPGKTYEMTDGKGKFWECKPDSIVATEEAMQGRAE